MSKPTLHMFYPNFKNKPGSLYYSVSALCYMTYPMAIVYMCHYPLICDRRAVSRGLCGSAVVSVDQTCDLCSDGCKDLLCSIQMTYLSFQLVVPFMKNIDIFISTHSSLFFFLFFSFMFLFPYSFFKLLSKRFQF